MGHCGRITTTHIPTALLGRLALVSVALATAGEGGATGITLTTDRRNEPAIRLYKRAGFRDGGSYEVYLNTFSGS